MSVSWYNKILISNRFVHNFHFQELLAQNFEELRREGVGTLHGYSWDQLQKKINQNNVENFEYATNGDGDLRCWTNRCILEPWFSLATRRSERFEFESRKPVEIILWTWNIKLLCWFQPRSAFPNSNSKVAVELRSIWNVQSLNQIFLDISQVFL